MPTTAAIYAQAVTDLANVRASIARIEGTTSGGGAQSVGIGGSQIVRAQLDALYKRLAILEHRVARYEPTGSGAVSSPDTGGDKL